MTETIQCDVLHRHTAPVDVRTAKKATLYTSLRSENAATALVLTVQESPDGLVWIDTATTVSGINITVAGIATSVIDIDGVSLIRAAVTTVSSAASLIEVYWSIQQEV